MITINKLIADSIVITTGPVDDGKTRVKYTASSGIQDWEGDIVGEFSSIPNKYDAEVVEIGSHVTSIDDFAFSGCSALKSVTIPDSVTSIGFDAFSITGLTRVTFSGKDKATIQGMANHYWGLPSGCVIHCTDGDITL